MSSRLDRVEDWVVVAVKCEYDAKQMAGWCGVSERQLRRHFLRVYGITAREWADNLRIEEAGARLCRGEFVKVVAQELNFKHTSHFSQHFKKVTGVSPSQFFVTGKISTLDDMADGY